ncbi:unnamed protein product [Brugia timori]|uniref:Ovule protein n=1 Tax=Brugia timori TaxID=42155 RepID=A0A0R3QNG7_9BILA|nr:unnamed protein product [Brugia timori]
MNLFFESSSVYCTEVIPSVHFPYLSLLSSFFLLYWFCRCYYTDFSLNYAFTLGTSLNILLLLREFVPISIKF